MMFIFFLQQTTDLVIFLSGSWRFLNFPFSELDVGPKTVSASSKCPSESCTLGVVVFIVGI